MDEATLGQIFDPFFTTKPSGVRSGLGLSSAQRIVQQNGGTIEVESALGAGTTFHLYLPQATDTERVGPGKQARRPQGRAGAEATILIVDDDVAVRALVELVLVDAGYRVLAAASPHDALELARNKQRPIDLLLTDMVMPRMSGTELAATLMPQRPEMRVLYMSGYEEQTAHPPAHRRNTEDFLAKPFTPDELLARVAAALADVTT